MKRNLRVIVDTNVLISGLFGKKNSPSSHILSAIRAQTITLVTSPMILEEVSVVIHRERIIKLTNMNTRELFDFMNELIQRSEVTEGKQLTVKVGRDIKDDKFLACSVEAKVEYIITGDEDLLVLKAYEGVKIVSPREFMEVL